MKEKMNQLNAAVKSFDESKENVSDKAILARDLIVKCMNELREVVDNIEKEIDANDWPIPTYIDLLFGI